MNNKNIIDFYIKLNPIEKKKCLEALNHAARHDVGNKIKDIKSSFAKEKYWKLFFLIGYFSDKFSIYEYGVLHGYSLLSFAFGKLLSGSKKKIIGQDLFEKYEFNKSSFLEIKKKIKKFKLDRIIELKKKNLMHRYDYNKNIFELKKIKNPGIHMVDLSNCGAIVESAIKNTNWKKIEYLIFEGGSKDRDNVLWMKDRKRKKIKPILNFYMKKNFEILTLNYFPSLSIVRKK